MQLLWWLYAVPDDWSVVKLWEKKKLDYHQGNSSKISQGCVKQREKKLSVKPRRDREVFGPELYLQLLDYPLIGSSNEQDVFFPWYLDGKIIK